MRKFSSKGCTAVSGRLLQPLHYLCPPARVSRVIRAVSCCSPLLPPASLRFRLQDPFIPSWSRLSRTTRGISWRAWSSLAPICVLLALVVCPAFRLASPFPSPDSAHPHQRSMAEDPGRWPTARRARARSNVRYALKMLFLANGTLAGPALRTEKVMMTWLRRSPAALAVMMQDCTPYHDSAFPPLAAAPRCIH